MRNRIVVVFLATLMAAGGPSTSSPMAQQPPAGQATPAPRAAQNPPPIRTTTRLVEANVIAEDKNGNPVADLTRDEFSLTDKGQAQEIRIFSMETTREIPATGPPLPPNTYANRRPNQGSLPGTVSVILIDTLNTKVQNQTYAREQIVKFLKQIRPEDRIALYVLGNNLHILHDYTNNAASLLRALGHYQSSPSRELQISMDPSEMATGVQEIDDFLRTMYLHEQDFFTLTRVQKTVVALEAIANHLAPIPGRKNLIWLSDSFPIAIGFERKSLLDAASSAGRSETSIPSPAQSANSSRMPVRFDADIERATRALNNSNIAVYPVQATGLDPNLRPIESGLAPYIGGGVPGSMVQPVIARASFESGQDAMNLMAERTGGRAYYNMNDLGNAIRRSIDDSRVTYLVGYYPTHNDWNGDFREIKVSVKRPGVRLRYRKGYFAVRDKALDNAGRRALLEQTAWSPLDAVTIGLTVKLERSTATGANNIKLSILADAQDVQFDQEGTFWLGTLDLYFLEKGPEGRPLSTDYRTLDMKITDERHGAIVKQGIGIVRHLDMANGATQVRVLVRDNRTGQMGSVTIPLADTSAKAPA